MADTINTKTLAIEPEMLDIIAELDEFGCLACVEHTGAGAPVCPAASSDNREHWVVDAHRGQQAYAVWLA